MNQSQLTAETLSTARRGEKMQRGSGNQREKTFDVEKTRENMRRVELESAGKQVAGG